MNNKENKQSLPVKMLLIVAAILFATYAYWDLENTNVGLENQIAELNKSLSERDEEIEELTYEYKELDEYLERLMDTHNESYEKAQSQYRELYRDYEQLKLEKSVPVYHCEHSESSIINLVYSFLDEYGNFQNCVEYRIDNNLVAVPDKIFTGYDEWMIKLEEAVNYDAYEDYELYLYEKDEQKNSFLERISVTSNAKGASASYNPFNLPSEKNKLPEYGS